MIEKEVIEVVAEQVNKPTEPWWMNLIFMAVFVFMAFFLYFGLEATLDANAAMKGK